LDAKKKERVVVAMSGGVDSSVAALLLQESGCEVIGISMRLWSYEPDVTHGCCTLEDLYDARRVADRLKIPYYVYDFEEAFEEKVVAPFVESYKFGETPNPCIRCNTDIKFQTLLKKAEELGASHLATGHYARIERRNDRYHLLRAADSSRDQSYFLFGLGQRELAKTLFPLGELKKKDDVRRLASDAGLPVSEKPDSQEICFVPGNYVDFVETRISKEDVRPGKVRNEKGESVGEHGGIHRFTVGQRKGLGIQSLLPTYVLEIRKDGDIVVGPDEGLFKRTFEVRETRWVDEPPREGERVSVQIRSRFQAASAVIEACGGDGVRVSFEESQRAITPGQAAVLYRDDEVLGGGWIDRVVA
jgi:tRNA-uridine 2-sulfurtransferase